MLCRIVLQKLIDDSDALTASIIREMGAVITSETSINFYKTSRRNISYSLP